MPFTISHAAAVLPLRRIARSRIPLAAMMIGSMAPDFGYFFPLGLGRDVMHSAAGLFQYCLPLGLLAWLFFVRVLEQPTLEVLPSPWRERWPRSEPISLKLVMLAALGVVIGALTHVAWDAFTHANTPLDSITPVTYTEVFEIRGRTIRIYGLLQYLSSIVGMFALAWWGWNLRKAPVVDAKPVYGFLSDRARITALLAVPGVTAGVAAFSYLMALDYSFEDRVFAFLTHGVSAGVFTWIVGAVLIRVTSLRQATTGDL